MEKKKRTKEEIMEDIKNYVPEMTEGESSEDFYRKLSTHGKGKGKEQ